MARRLTLLTVAAFAAACSDATGLGRFESVYHIVGFSATGDTAFTGSLLLVAQGGDSVRGTADFSSVYGAWSGWGVVTGDTLTLSLAPARIADIGRGFTGTLTGSEIVGTWVDQGFTPQPPPSGPFTAHRS